MLSEAFAQLSLTGAAELDNECLQKERGTAMQVGARSYIHARNPWGVFRWTFVGLIFASQLAWLAYARGQALEAKNPYAHDPAALRKGEPPTG